MTQLEDNLKKVQMQMEEAKKNRTKYREEAVTLVAVTKTVSQECILPALSKGIVHVGENYVQEILEKWDTLSQFHVHMIGPLQTNKVRLLPREVTLIQSLDRLSLLKELERIGKRDDRIFHCLVQVNVAREIQKSGIAPEDLSSLLQYNETVQHVKILGLMNIAPFAEDPEEIRWVFREMRNLFDMHKNIVYNNTSMQYLSMGMSHDFTVAIEEGSNMVRIGSAIFGNRKYT